MMNQADTGQFTQVEKTKLGYQECQATPGLLIVGYGPLQQISLQKKVMQQPLSRTGKSLGATTVQRQKGAGSHWLCQRRLQV